MRKMLLLLLGVNMLFSASEAETLYVNQMATGNNDGSSWENAYNDLSIALENAKNRDDIWVAKGIYKPDKIFDVNGDSILEPREATFKIPDGVQLFGGFSGNEIELSQRDWQINKTILSGDIDNNDSDPDSNGIIENSDDIVGKNAYHVVVTIALDFGSYADGFYITAGLADSESSYFFEPNTNGGGWYNDVQLGLSYPNFYNLAFYGNMSKFHGGAIFFTIPYGSLTSSRLYNCSFFNNKSTYGGAIFANSTLNYVGFALNIDNCSFTSNEALQGGALSLHSDKSYILNSFFNKNKAKQGGAIYLNNPKTFIFACVFNQNEVSQEGGAISMYATYQEATEMSDSNPELVNCHFYKNRAEGEEQANGGAVFNKCNTNVLKVKYINCMFYENTSQNNGGAIANIADILQYNPYNDAALTSTLINCTFNKNFSGENGGAIYNYGSNFLEKEAFRLDISNCILWNDSALNENTKEISSNSVDNVSFSIIQNSGGSGTNWNQNFGYDGGYNLDVDPLFVEIAFPGNSFGITLSPESPAINKGNFLDPDNYYTDILGNSRVQQSMPDLGAVEVEGNKVQKIIFVDQNANGAKTGTSWKDAFMNISDALPQANPEDEIWVAKGVYKPTMIVDIDKNNELEAREATFYILRSIKMYGGFSGTESTLAQRDLNTNRTILSGDIDNNDLDPNNDGLIENVDDIVGNNSYHVMYINIRDSGSIIDGFTINAGLANAIGKNNNEERNFAPNSCGGGLYYRPVDIEKANNSPKLKNAIFIANLAESLGGGYYIESNRMLFGNIDIKIENTQFKRNLSKTSAGALSIGAVNLESRFFVNIKKCEFIENEAREKGGAMYMMSDFSYIDSCSFISNKVIADFKTNNSFSGSGGAVFLELSNPIFNHCIFAKNVATGSDMKCFAGGGAIFNYTNNSYWALKWGSEPEFRNCYFQKNVAAGQNFAYGGAVNNYSEDGELNTNFVNCMFFKNNAQNGGGACANIEAFWLFRYAAKFTNCTFLSNHSEKKGGAIYNECPYFSSDFGSSYVKLENSILWNNTAMLGNFEEISSVSINDDNEESKPEMIEIKYSLVKGCGGANWQDEIGTNGSNNLDDNPLFKIETTNSGIVMAKLSSSSPAINAGNNNAEFLPDDLKDLAGSQRIFDDFIDLGAYEYQGLKTRVKSYLTNSNAISIYPVPAKDYIIVSSNIQEAKFIEIYNIKGQLVIQETLTSNEKRINLEGNAPGIFVVELKTAQGIVVDKRRISKM